MDVNPGSDTAADPSIARGFVGLPERQLALAVLGVILAEDEANCTRLY